MLYQIVYSGKKGRRVVTPDPVELLFALSTVNRLTRYKVNPPGDYLIEPVAGTSVC